jgi:signal transduction histidine kinase
LNTAFIGESLISSTGVKMLAILQQILSSLSDVSEHLKCGQDHILLKTCKEKLNIAVTDIHSILETAAFIKESCELSLKVLNDALTFDKIDGSMINLELEEVELIPFVDSIIESYKSHDESSKVQILSKFVDIVDNSNIESFILKADKIKIRQVLSNFISNALKFTQSGEINIVVELKKIPVSL